MNVLVIGANGKIGQKIVGLLGKGDHQVTAMVRKEEQMPELEKLGAKAVLGDLEKDITHAVEGSDAVIFTAGSGAKTGADKTILIDQEGAIKAADAAVAKNVDRFIIVSAMIPEDLNEADEAMKPYFAAKNRADDYLKNTSLNYTILRPGKLTDEEGTGKIDAAESLGRKADIPRDDVAQAAVEALGNAATYKKTIELLSGDQPISEALKNL